jgi:P2-related tail formation protein
MFETQLYKPCISFQTELSMFYMRIHNAVHAAPNIRSIQIIAVYDYRCINVNTICSVTATATSAITASFQPNKASNNLL